MSGGGEEKVRGELNGKVLCIRLFIEPAIPIAWHALGTTPLNPLRIRRLLHMHLKHVCKAKKKSSKSAPYSRTAWSIHGGPPKHVDGLICTLS
jgi:hypothetical protein